MKKSTRRKLKILQYVCLVVLVAAAAGGGWFYVNHLEQVRQEKIRAEVEEFVKTYKEVFDIVRERNEREIALRREYDLKAIKKMEEILGKPIPRREAVDAKASMFDQLAGKLYQDLDRVVEAERHLQGVEKERPYDIDVLIVGGMVHIDKKARRPPPPSAVQQPVPPAAN